MLPSTTLVPGGVSPSTESAVMLLPLPDSPIRPTNSPGHTSRLTPFTGLPGARPPDRAANPPGPHFEAAAVHRLAGAPPPRDLNGQAVNSQCRSTVAGTVR